MRIKKLFRSALVLAMLVGMIPGMSMTLSAEGAANPNSIKPLNLTGTGNIPPVPKPEQTISAFDVRCTYGETGCKIEAVVTDPKTGGGTLSYAVKSGDAVTVEPTTGELTIVKAGSAVITVTAKETSVYAQTTRDVNVTVEKADPVANAPTGLTATYGQKLSDVSLENKNPDGNTEGTWVWADSSTVVGAVGNRTFKANFTPADKDNFNSVSGVDVTVKVNKAAPSVTAPTPRTLTYDTYAHDLIDAGSTGDGTLYYAVTTGDTAPEDETRYTTSVPTGLEVGTYYVWYCVKGDSNHADTAPEAVSVAIGAPKTHLHRWTYAVDGQDP